LSLKGVEEEGFDQFK